MTNPPASLFHGGIPGLQEGDLILPPSETGVLTIAEVLKRNDQAVWLASGYAKDRPAAVSLTRSLSEARYYGALWTVIPWRAGSGHVYRVEPAGKPVRVPGWPEWTCSQATVLEVVSRGVSREAGYALGGDAASCLAAEELYWRLWRDRGYPLPAPGRVVVRQREQCVS